jgi:hypothetical protein
MESVRSRITLGDRTIEQLAHYSYLECDVPFKQYDNDEKENLQTLQVIHGTVNGILGNKARKDMKPSF